MKNPLSFEYYTMLNTLWRLTFRKGTSFTITLQELLDSFHRMTPEYKTSPITVKHVCLTLKSLEKDRYIRAQVEDEKVQIVMFCEPFLIAR